jgi:hypothetical protein
MRNAYKILIVKSVGKRPLVRYRSRWKGKIRIDLRCTGWEGVDCIQLAEDRNQWRIVVNTVMNLRVP